MTARLVHPLVGLCLLLSACSAAPVQSSPAPTATTPTTTKTATTPATSAAVDVVPASQVVVSLPRGHTVSQLDTSAAGVVWSGAVTDALPTEVYYAPVGGRETHLASTTLGAKGLISWVGLYGTRAYWVETTVVEKIGQRGGPWRLRSCEVSSCRPVDVMTGKGGPQGPKAPQPRITDGKLVVALCPDFGVQAYSKAEVVVLDAVTGKVASRTALNSTGRGRVDVMGDNLVFESMRPYPDRPVTKPIEPKAGLDVFTVPLGSSSADAVALSVGHSDGAPAAQGDRVAWIHRDPPTGETGSLWVGSADKEPTKLADVWSETVWFDGRHVLYTGEAQTSLVAIDTSSPNLAKQVLVGDVVLARYDSASLDDGVVTYAAVTDDGAGQTEIRRIDLRP